MDETIKSVLAVHRQRANWSCSASAHEFIGKLHGKIPISDVPLQDLPTSHKGGFQFEDFLNSIGYTGTEMWLPPSEALELLKLETARGRFPLVSVFDNYHDGKINFHIVVGIPVVDGVAIADPAKQKFIAEDSATTLDLLNQTVAAVQNRPKINLLIYAAL